MKYFGVLIGLLIVFCFSCTISSQEKSIEPELPLLDRIYLESHNWVDSVMTSLSEDQKIAQLFWLAVEYPVGTSGYNSLRSLVEKNQPGGLLIMRMRVEEAHDVITDLQSVSETPLLVSIDAETGLFMRMNQIIAFPQAMTLGAIANDSLIYRMGLEVARQLRIMGIHVNMAPVADVNSNPANPVIGMRSFGEEPNNVAHKSVAFMRGLQDGRIMAVGKHFPGHGDTSTDSHHTLPIVKRSKEEFEAVDLLPFRALVDNGIWGVMTAHLHTPALEPKSKIPTSFSKAVIEDLLRKELGFQGLVITDAINMQGAKFMGKAGQIDAMALAAGNDVVEFTENLPEAIISVKRAVADSLLSWEDIELKCRRSLAFKYWLIHEKSTSEVVKENLVATINNSEAKQLNQELYDAALTVLNFDKKAPRNSEFVKDSIAFLVLGDGSKYDKVITNYSSSVFNFSTESEWNEINKKLKEFKHCVVVISDGRWGMKSTNNVLKLKLAEYLSKSQSTIVFMGNPYHISNWNSFSNANTFILTYQSNNEAMKSALKFLSGEIGASGKLPVSVQGLFEVGSGVVVD